eukprot:1249897-Rhodomonas_salina.1
MGFTRSLNDPTLRPEVALPGNFGRSSVHSFPHQFCASLMRPLQSQRTSSNNRLKLRGWMYKTTTTLCAFTSEETGSHRAVRHRRAEGKQTERHHDQRRNNAT